MDWNFVLAFKGSLIVKIWHLYYVYVFLVKRFAAVLDIFDFMFFFFECFLKLFPLFVVNALKGISFLFYVLQKREQFQDLAPLLWNSFGTIAALLQVCPMPLVLYIPCL